MRPTKYNRELHEKICALIRSGTFKSSAAMEAGVSVDSVDRWVAEGERDENSIYAEFARDLRQAEGELENRHARHLSNLALGLERGTHQPVVEYLKRRFPKNWGDRAALEHSGRDGGPIVTERTPAEVSEIVRKKFGKITPPVSDDDSDSDADT